MFIRTFMFCSLCVMAADNTLVYYKTHYKLSYILHGLQLLKTQYKACVQIFDRNQVQYKNLISRFLHLSIKVL